MTRETPASGLEGGATYKHIPTALPLPASALSLPSLCPSSTSDFSSLVFAGQLYELLMRATGLGRDQVKLAFLRDVLAKKGRYPSRVEQAFREMCPAVYRYIRLVNREDHAELIRRLQRLESWLVVETVAPLLIGRVPCLTLHDAIFSSLPSLPEVEAAFNRTFDEIGCRLKLKREMA